MIFLSYNRKFEHKNIIFWFLHIFHIFQFFHSKSNGYYYNNDKVHIHLIKSRVRKTSEKKSMANYSYLNFFLMPDISNFFLILCCLSSSSSKTVIRHNLQIPPSLITFFICDIIVVTCGVTFVMSF